MIRWAAKCFGLSVFIAGGFCSSVLATIPVHVEYANNRYQLIRNGQPYFIKGAGGKKYFDRLAEYGGNSIRTWGTENAQSILDEAEKLGLTVTLGLWMGHQNHGFNYDNELIVANQLERFRQDVLKYKDHPALLMWSVGNEVNLNYSNVKVWDAVEDIAKMIAELDGRHPVMTVLAGAPKADVQLIMQKCPHIEILGINSYAALPNIPDDLNNAGWNRPFIITEWGPNGYWEVAATEWGAALEQNSSEKSETYLRRYEEVISVNNDRNLGSYVFLWGDKREVTPTWFGMFLDNGRETAMVDSVRYAWNGYWPENRSPEIGDLIMQDDPGNEAGVRLSPNTEYLFYVSLVDPDGDELSLGWTIQGERGGSSIGVGGQEISVDGNALVQGEEGIVQFRAPEKAGAYRLFVFGYDSHNHAATANIPFIVD